MTIISNSPPGGFTLTSNSNKYTIDKSILDAFNGLNSMSFQNPDLAHNTEKSLTEKLVRVTKYCPHCATQLVWETMTTTTSEPGQKTQHKTENTKQPDGVVVFEGTNLVVGAKQDTITINCGTYCSLDCMVQNIKQKALESRLEQK